MRLSASVFLTATILLIGAAMPAWADAARGSALFKAQCGSCHKQDHNYVGPLLGGVFGRKAGAADRFAYSDALKNSSLTWDAPTLNKWLMSPAKLVSGTHMTMQVDAVTDRADIIDYLKDLPVPE